MSNRTKSSKGPRPFISGTNGRQMRADGWKNAITSLGTTSDKRQSTEFVREKRIGDNQLSAIWRANGWGRRVIDVVPDDVFRNWFDVTNDEEDRVNKKLEDLGAQPKCKRAHKLARCYGGSIVLMGINDGGDLDAPVNVKRIKSVDYLNVFDRRDITIQSTQINRDPLSPTFGEPISYEIIPRFGAATQPGSSSTSDPSSRASMGGGASGRFVVHASRVIRFDGSEVGWNEYQGNGYWMDSILEFIYEHIRQLGSVYDSSEFIVEAFVQTTIKIKNLLQMIATGNDKLLQRRLNWLDMSRHVANTELLDSEEEYQKHSSTVAGLGELIDQFKIAVSGVTGIPVTRLFGMSPAGMNATGESDQSNYYDDIRSAQRNDIGPRIRPLVSYIWASKGFKEPTSWSMKWLPLHDPTPNEIGEHYKATAEGDAIYVSMQAIDPEVIARKRFVGDHFDFEPISMTADEFDEMNGAIEEEEEADRLAREAQLESMRQQQAGNGNATPPNAGAGDDEDEEEGDEE